MIPVRFACDCTQSGYGNAARGYLRALEHLGWDRNHVRVVPAVFWRQEALDAPDNDWLRKTYLDAYDGRPEPEMGINVVHVHPCYLGRFWSAGWYNIAVTAWETNQLPSAKYPGVAGAKERTVIETLNECYDEIWVPTERVKKTFTDCGVTKPITVVPHALLPELLERAPRTEGPVVPELHPKATGQPGSACRMYTIGTWDPRKDPMTLLQAYYRTGWKIYNAVSLLLHASNNGREQQWDVENLRNTQPDWADLPSMSLCSGEKDYGWVLDVHSGGHVYVTATHGEGFCLPAVEALAMCNLVMGPKEPLSHLQWAIDAGFFVPIECHEEDIAVMPNHAGYEMGQTWWGTQLTDLTDGLKKAWELAREGLLPLAEGAEEARKRYSVEAVAAVIKPRLEEAQRVLKGKEW